MGAGKEGAAAAAAAAAPVATVAATTAAAAAVKAPVAATSNGNDHHPQQQQPPAQQEQRGSSTSHVTVSDAGSTPACTPRGVLLRCYHYALEQWFILGLGFAVGFAAAVPKLGATGGYIHAEYSIKLPAIIIIFIISGLGLRTRALLTAAGDLRIHVLVQGLSLAAIPALGYAIALGLRRQNFDPHLADGLVIMACMPTTVSTNVVYTQRAGGNEPASLVNAVIGNIIGIFITPLWLSLFLDVHGAAPYSAVLVELSYTIIAPLIIGQLMQFFTPRVVAWIKKNINTSNVSSVCILLIVWLTFCNTFGSKTMAGVAGKDVAAIVFLDAALFFLFAAICFFVAWPPPPLSVARRALRLSPPDAVSVVICGCMKTVAMGVPLISVMYKSVPYAGLLALPLILYHALQVLLGGIALAPLKHWCVTASAAEDARKAAAAADAAAAKEQLPRSASDVVVDGSGPPAAARGGKDSFLVTFSRRFSRHRSFLNMLPKS